MTPDRLDRGLVVVLPGIEGRSPLNVSIAEGLADGGVPYAIEIYDWTRSYNWLANLRDQKTNRRTAMRIANRIASYQWDYPGRPVYIVGQSGGGAMAAWVAESMPDGHKLDGVVMIAAALSPKYSLTWALEGTRHGIVNFHSQRDLVLLGIGTTVAGTMDGQHGASAGLSGFEVPERAPGVYDKLYQIGWNRDMAAAGHIGLHVSSSASEFVAQYVAPLVMAPRWTPSLIDRVAHQRGEPNGRTAGPVRAAPDRRDERVP